MRFSMVDRSITVSNGTSPPLNGIRCAEGGVQSNHRNGAGASSVRITTVGIDLAKNVFQVHCVVERDKTV
jgi:hypothetical protein